MRKVFDRQVVGYRRRKVYDFIGGDNKRLIGFWWLGPNRLVSRFPRNHRRRIVEGIKSVSGTIGVFDAVSFVFEIGS